MSSHTDLLRSLGHEVVEVEHEVLGTIVRVARVKHDHPPVRDVNAQMAESFSVMERMALFITRRVGTFGFFLIILGWTVVWLGWNLVGPANLRFDPAPAFVLWLFISNMIQITLMPLMLIGQNLLSRHAEYRAESDFEINQKAEKEIEVILLHLEHQAAQIERQGQLILDILHRLSQAEAAAPNGDVPH